MEEKSFTYLQAKSEASRCLMCADAPCVCDCAAGVNPRKFIRKIRFDNFEGAVRELRQSNVLAGSCSYICPTGTLCCKSCLASGLLHPIDISGLQRFVMDWERKVGMIEPLPSKRDGKKVAVIGSGPAGLGCAAELAVRGHMVTVFEKSDVLGGMLREYIPSFRLPVEVVDFEIEFIRKLGVEFVCNENVGDPKKLLKEYKAVFIATGLSKPESGDIVASNMNGVYQALDLLHAAKKEKLPPLGKRVVVIGGGDTALDAARVAKRNGSECLVLYRRTQKEMPAYPVEIMHAWDEGIEFYFRTIVRSVVGDDSVKGVRCVRIKWRDEVFGRAKAYDVEGMEFTIACDSVVLALGQKPDSIFDLRATPNNLLAVTKDTFKTSEERIFAGGDVTMGGGTAARAVGMGKQAAIKIDEYLKG